MTFFFEFLSSILEAHTVHDVALQAEQMLQDFHTHKKSFSH